MTSTANAAESTKFSLDVALGREKNRGDLFGAVGSIFLPNNKFSCISIERTRKQPAFLSANSASFSNFWSSLSVELLSVMQNLSTFLQFLKLIFFFSNLIKPELRIVEF